SSPPQSVRLNNGTSRCSGTVEIKQYGNWTGICLDFWNQQAADVVCRQLGCGLVLEGNFGALNRSTAADWPTVGNATDLPANQSSVVLGPKLLKVNCTGTELDLKNCLLDSVSLHRCYHSNLSRVTCNEHRDIRLVGGSTRCAGRVEVLQYGAWGTVCDDLWGQEEAQVVCRQLGCGFAVAALGSAHFGKGRGEVYLDDLNCTGSEQYLWDCPAEAMSDCGHKEDAGVICSEHREMRLTGGLDRCAGQLELYYEGRWRMVCDISWGNYYSDIVCREMGCGSSRNFTSFFHNSADNWAFYCVPNVEYHLWECKRSLGRPHLCNNITVIGIICNENNSLCEIKYPRTLACINELRTEPGITMSFRNKMDAVSLLSLLCIVLGVLFLAVTTTLVVVLLRMRQRKVLRSLTLENANRENSTIPDTNEYTDAGSSLPPPPSISWFRLCFAAMFSMPKADEDSSEDDYEHYDFSAKPPMPLSTF
uniref:SRCR domain-containing protein n=1 Tax=Latimeria chalumnae TaxID=7897 RepID=H3A8Y5_LATCH